MKTKIMILLALLAVASPLMAQQGGAAATGGTNWGQVAAYFAMTLASVGCGLGQAKAVSAAVEGMARNPGASTAIRGALILGLALIESLALYTLVIIFAK